jgi:hypothetical protein
MGVQTSQNESLDLLLKMPESSFTQTLAALEQRSLKMQMEVSKWDLYMIMQMSQPQIRKILTFLKGQDDPRSI